MYYMVLGKFPLLMLFDCKLHNGVYCKEDKTCEVWMFQIKQICTQWIFFCLVDYIFDVNVTKQVKTQVKWLDKSTNTYRFWYFFVPIILWVYCIIHYKKRQPYIVISPSPPTQRTLVGLNRMQYLPPSSS